MSTIEELQTINEDRDVNYINITLYFSFFLLILLFYFILLILLYFSLFYFIIQLNDNIIALKELGGIDGLIQKLNTNLNNGLNNNENELNQRRIKFGYNEVN